MPVTPPVSYPGMYIQEVESPVHTIAPMPTATTAFIGRALRGPLNDPVLIHNYADFNRLFGGLWLESKLGYAVYAFFLNGGQDALIVRIFHPNAPSAGKASLALQGQGPAILLEAAHPGAWGNSLCARVTAVDPNISKQLADQLGVKAADLFTLNVYDAVSGRSETFPNLTVVPSPRRLDKVLQQESRLLRVAGSLAPDATRPDLHPAPEPGKNWWQDPQACSPADGQGSDGESLTAADILGDRTARTGIYALANADIFNLLYIPPYQDLAGEGAGDVEPQVLEAAAEYCTERRAMLLIDSPASWTEMDKVKNGFPYPYPGSPSANTAIYFPRVQMPNPLRANQIEALGPGGAIAGVFARTDRTRGVWKAPAGLDATLAGVYDLTVPLTDAENGELTPLGINCLRNLPAAGPVVWGARTTQGDDRLASEWKYVPVRRTALFIEESLYRGSQWAVFEPNDEPLWAQLRLNFGAFMLSLFRQGAFQGQSPKDAYFVQCDSTTTTQSDIDRGIVNIVVGFAPLKPAEFVVLYIQQIAGQLVT
jgi:phage tail sheath protein FI